MHNSCVIIDCPCLPETVAKTGNTHHEEHEVQVATKRIKPAVNRGVFHHHLEDEDKVHGEAAGEKQPPLTAKAKTGNAVPNQEADPNTGLWTASLGNL